MKVQFDFFLAQIDMIESDSDDAGPLVMVGGKQYSLDDITDSLIAEMTPQEKETYITVYQDHFSLMYD
jgi:transcription initiation factor TFIIE subunit alpha